MRSANSKAVVVAWELLGVVSVLSCMGMHGSIVSHRSGRITGERDEGGVEGASDVFDGHFHWSDVGCIALRGPSQDMAADATG